MPQPGLTPVVEVAPGALVRDEETGETTEVTDTVAVYCNGTLHVTPRVAARLKAAKERRG